MKSLFWNSQFFVAVSSSSFFRTWCHLPLLLILDCLLKASDCIIVDLVNWFYVFESTRWFPILESSLLFLARLFIWDLILAYNWFNQLMIDRWIDEWYLTSCLLQGRDWLLWAKQVPFPGSSSTFSIQISGCPLSSIDCWIHLEIRAAASRH